MAEQSPFIEVLEKNIKWSSLVGITIPISGVKVYQRVEKLDPILLDNGILRILAVLKLFAVVTTEQEQKHLFKPAKVFTNDVKISSFINLHADISREDINSIDYQVNIKNYMPRPDKIIVSGTLKLRISYVIYLVLEGSVIDFSSCAPINGATVNARTLESHEIVASTNTDKNGRYFFSSLPPGTYLVEALTESHKPQQKVSVIKTRDTVDFVLHR